LLFCSCKLNDPLAIVVDHRHHISRYPTSHYLWAASKLAARVEKGPSILHHNSQPVFSLVFRMPIATIAGRCLRAVATNGRRCWSTQML
jgi:hypothetical protein